MCKSHICIIQILFLQWAKEEVLAMRTTMKLKLTHDEVRVLVYALNELRNTLIAENRYTDAVDEILARLIV